MAIMSDLPHDVLVSISKRLKKLEDFVSFRCVSRSLYAAGKDEYFEGLRLRQRLPYLLLPVKDDNDDTRELYSLVEGESIVASVNVPKFKVKKCFESLGWLLAVEEDGNMSLLDPFSGNEIPLPHQKTFPGYKNVEMEEFVFMQKMVLSSNPNEDSDFVLMVIFGGCGHLGFWRLGDKAWSRIKEREGRYSDFVYHGDGIFYAVGLPGTVWAVRFDKSNKRRAKAEIIVRCGRTIVPFGAPDEPSPDYPSKNLYILETVDNSLLIITRASPILSEDGSSYITTKFKVYEVDRVKRSWKEIDSLGNNAVFIGHSSTIALDTTRFPGGVIKANHIYFTADDLPFYYYFSKTNIGGGLDIGVYNMETGTVVPFYLGKPLCSKISTSFWITPPCF